MFHFDVKKKSLLLAILGFGGGARNFRRGGLTGAKIWFSGYYKCQKSPKKLLFTFRRGTSMLRQRGNIPLALLWRHPCLVHLLDQLRGSCDRGHNFVLLTPCNFIGTNNHIELNWLACCFKWLLCNNIH